jgi:hypothetical protein
MDKQGRPGARRVDDLPHDASGHGAPSATPPVMVPPAPKETLLLYISTSTQVVSTVLVAERPEEGQPYPV